MRGAVIYAPRRHPCEDRPDPTILAPPDAIIRTTATCVCGSDLWPYRGIENVRGPAPMGHEYVGGGRGGRERGFATSPPVTRGRLVLRVGQHVRDLRAGYQSRCVNAEPMGAIGTQAQLARIPLADGTLVATPGMPDADLIPGCSPRPTSSAPAGSARLPPRPAR